MNVEICPQNIYKERHQDKDIQEKDIQEKDIKDTTYYASNKPTIQMLKI